MKKLLIVLLLCTSACAGVIANLPAIAQDIAGIVAIVWADVQAGKPFPQILADTGSDDAALVLAIFTAIEGNPKATAAERAAYARLCDPYIVQAKALLAKQHAQGLYLHPSYRVHYIASTVRLEQGAY